MHVLEGVCRDFTPEIKFYDHKLSWIARGDEKKICFLYNAILLPSFRIYSFPL